MGPRPVCSLHDYECSWSWHECVLHLLHGCSQCLLLSMCMCERHDHARAGNVAAASACMAAFNLRCGSKLSVTTHTEECLYMWSCFPYQHPQWPWTSVPMHELCLLCDTCISYLNCTVCGSVLLPLLEKVLFTHNAQRSESLPESLHHGHLTLHVM